MQSSTVGESPQGVRETVTFENEQRVCFGIAEGFERDRCPRCLQLIEQYGVSNGYCINCWKLEVPFNNCNGVEAVKEHLIRESLNTNLHGKKLKDKVKIPSELLAIMHEGACPENGIEDSTVLLNTESIKERDKRRLLKNPSSKGICSKESITCQRGCVNFDFLIGNQKAWHAISKDYLT